MMGNFNTLNNITVPLEESEVIVFIKNICMELQKLHCQPVPQIYGNMKPENILISSNGDVRLINPAKSCRDWNGVEEVYEVSGFWAPEHWHDELKSRENVGYPLVEELLSVQTDIYELGMVVRYLFGDDPSKPPYNMKMPLISNVSLSKGMEYIIEKCTKMDPKDRYESCKALCNDLENIENLPPCRIIKFLSKESLCAQKSSKYKR